VSKRLPKTIVGFDPGTTAGLAVLNLNGELLLLKSLRHWSRSSIILEALNVGDPVLIATDRAEVPRAVRELAQSLNLTVFETGKEETLEDKASVINEYASKRGVTIGDEHQASALYAALKAYNSFKNDFKNIELSVERRMSDFKEALIDEVKSDLIKGIPPERSIRERLSQPTVQSVDANLVEQLRKQLLEERRKVEVLALKLESLRSELRKAESKKLGKEAVKSIVSFTPGGSRLTSLSQVLGSREKDSGERLQVDVFTELTSKKAKSEVGSMVVAAETLKGDLRKIFKALSSRGVRILILDAGTVEDEAVKEAAYHGLLLCDIKSLPLEKLDEKLYVRRSDIRELLNRRRNVLTAALIERLTELSLR
jgi:predicted RNase H-like nuclease (RuvC/YqgF family)